MKKLLIPTFISIISITGCVTTANFFDLKSTTMEYSGNWTGAHQNISVATLKIKQDGTGIICQDYNGVAKVVAIKKVQDKIYTQDGSFWKIKNISSDNLELAYGMGGSYFLKKDDNLTLATPACLEKLK